MDLPAEEEKLLSNVISDQEAGKGGLRTIPFIIVNESFERLASIGLTPNMVFYLMNDFHMEVAVVSTIFSLWSTLSNGLSIFGAAIADSYWGRFRVIAIGSFSSLLGMAGVWLTAMFPQLRGEACEKFSSPCNPPNAAQLSFLLFSFALISIGAGCVRPCCLSFGIDQLKGKENPNNKRLIQSFINWYNVSISVASVVALTVIVYIQDQMGWKVGFAIPTILMVFSASAFMLGSSFYVNVKPKNSLFMGLVQVMVAAFRNRNISLSPVSTDYSYHHAPKAKLLVPTASLRCLNKACVIKDPERDLNPDGSASNPWNLCAIEQVESLKAIIRVIPMWSSGIMLMVSLYQNSFSTLQAKTMNRHIIGRFEFPAASMGVIMLLSLGIWLGFYDRVLIPILAKHTGNPRGISPVSRIAISLGLSVVAMVISALVEGQRRKMVIGMGLEDHPYASITMSAMWLAPSYLLMGIAEGISATAQVEFFYAQLPKSMASIAIAIYTIEQAAASSIGAVFVNVVNEVTGGGGKISWLDSNINKGHVDYYYWLIAFIGFLNLFYFFVCLRAYPKGNDERGRSFFEDLAKDEEEEE